MKREVLFEFTRCGNAIRVAAVDPETLTEVVVSCPASCSESQLKEAGLARLEYVLQRRGLGQGRGPATGRGPKPNRIEDDHPLPWEGL